MVYESEAAAVGAVKQHLHLLPPGERKTPVLLGH